MVSRKLSYLSAMYFALVLFFSAKPVKAGWPVIKFPSNETVAILNEGDIELNTGNIPNAKVIMTAPSVETTGDVFVKGNAEGISAQLASLKSRLQSAEDEITTIKTEIASLDGTNGYVDVEQIRFTDKNIGISADADLITLASSQVTIGGTLKLDSTGDLEVAKALTSITHTGGTGMAISSTTGYVDIESIRFGGSVMGPTGDPDLVTLASGALTIAGTLSTTETFTVAGNKFSVASDTGNTMVLGTLGVTGAAMLSSSLAVNSDFAVATNKFKVTASSGDTTVAGTLTSSGDATMSATLVVTGATALSNTLDVLGATTLSGSLGVTGATTLASTLDVHGNLKVATDKFHVTAVNGNTVVGGSLGVAGAATLSGSLDVTQTFRVATSKFTVDHSSGNTAIEGTLSVDGAVTVAGNTAIAGTLSVDGAVTVAGKLVQTDPEVSAVTQDKWCVGTSGGQVECTANQPLLSLPSGSLLGHCYKNCDGNGCKCTSASAPAICLSHECYCDTGYTKVNVAKGNTGYGYPEINLCIKD